MSDRHSIKRASPADSWQRSWQPRWIAWRGQAWIVVLSAMIASAPVPARAQFGTGPVEVEPNDGKASADSNQGTWTLPAASTTGVIVGTTTGLSSSPGPASLDFYHLRVAAQPALGVYRHRLSIAVTSGSGNIGRLRGLENQSGATDQFIQSSFTSGGVERFVQWYGTGRAADVYFSVQGTTSTTEPYRVDYDVAAVTPKVAGLFAAGPMVLSTVNVPGAYSDTELFLYDAAMHQIGQNDDNVSPGTGGQSRIDITLAAGTYYAAVGDAGTMTNLANGAAAPLTPFSDSSTAGNRTDFVDNLVRNSVSSRAAGQFSLAIGDQFSQIVTASDAVGTFDVQWYRFTISPCPNSPSGDISGDGAVNGKDIRPFTQGVLSHSTALANLCAADFDHDGTLDGGDVGAFVARLLSP